MHLTEAGGELLRHSHEILRALKDAEESLDALRGLRAGRISTSASPAPRSTSRRDCSRASAMRIPRLAFRLTVSNRETVIEALAGNAVDLAIMGRPPQALGQRRRGLRAASVRDHRGARPSARPPPPLPVATIAHVPFLVREPGSGTRSAMQQFFDEHGIAVPVGMEMASNETIKQAVMAGMGVSFLSRHTVALELASGASRFSTSVGLPVMRDWFVVHLAAKRCRRSRSRSRRSY